MMLVEHGRRSDADDAIIAIRAARSEVEEAYTLERDENGHIKIGLDGKPIPKAVYLPTEKAVRCAMWTAAATWGENPKTIVITNDMNKRADGITVAEEEASKASFAAVLPARKHVENHANGHTNGKAKRRAPDA